MYGRVGGNTDTEHIVVRATNKYLLPSELYADVVLSAYIVKQYTCRMYDPHSLFMNNARVCTVGKGIGRWAIHVTVRWSI